LENRFDSEVELAVLRVRLPRLSPVQVLLTRGRGVSAKVEGDGVVLRYKGRRDRPPMFSMKKVGFDVDLGALFDETKIVHLVTIDGMEINVRRKVNVPGATRAMRRRWTTVKARGDRRQASSSKK